MLTPTELPHKLGRYTLLESLGSGGMADVYRAMLHGNQGFQKEVAIKILRQMPGEHAVTLMQWFIREGRLGGLLRHPNIVDVYEFGEMDGLFYLSMQYLEGQDLASLSYRKGALDAPTVLHIARSVLSALECAHTLEVNGNRKPVIHRDLKPSNLFLDKFGMVKVLDFGIAWFDQKYTKQQKLTGTPEYMAPEQMRAGAIDPRCDLFSLGTVLYDLLTARFLFDRQTHGSLKNKARLSEQFIQTPAVWEPIEQVCPALVSVLKRSVQPNPADRFQTASEFLHAIQQISDNVRSRGPRITRKPLFHREITDIPVTDPKLQPQKTVVPSTVSNHTSFSNIRRPLTKFVGRKATLRELGEHIRNPGVVTLLGTGGVGKTRLAVEAGLANLEHFEGVYFCDLSESNSIEEVTMAVTEAFQTPVHNSGEQSIQQYIGQHIQQLGGVLLILDNVEKSVEWVVQLLDMWVPLWPEVSILLTSRKPLEFAGEKPLRIAPLTQSEAIELFCARAQQPIKASDKALLPSLVTSIDCLPLAIELAARRMNVLSVQQLYDRLHHRFQLLRASSWTDTRHAVLEAVIESSWNDLSSWQQDTLMQCTVFQSSFTLEAAEEVVDLTHYEEAPWCLDAIATLVDQSILSIRRTRDERRFYLLENIRAFARQQLDKLPPHRRQELLDRHARYFGTEGAYLHKKPKPHPEDLGNFRVAHTHAKTRGWATEALHCADQSTHICLRVGPLQQAVLILQETERAFPDALAQNIGLLQQYGIVMRHARNYPKALWCYEQALSTATANQNRLQVARTHNQMGSLFKSQQNVEKGRKHYEQALQSARELNDSTLIEITTGNIGLCHKAEGDYPKAIAMLKKALTLSLLLGDPESVARNKINLITVYVESENFDNGRTLMKEVLDSGYGEKNTPPAAVVHEGMALLFIEEQEFEKAAKHLKRALHIWKVLGRSQRRAVAKIHKGLLEHRRGRPAESIRWLTEARQECERFGETGWAMYALGIQAQAMHDTGDPHAIARLQESIEYFRDVKDITQATRYQEILDGWGSAQAE